jgi:hypothetical protein
MSIFNDLLAFMGLHANTRWNLFWGGFGSCLTEFAIVAVVWRKVNCHAKGCYRVGLHHVDGTPYITCKKHHPVHPGAGALTAEQIAQAHQAARSAEAQGIPPAS